MFRNLHKSSIHVAGIFCLLLLAYHLIFRDYFPLANGRMGHDYVLTLGGFLDGFLWYKNNGFLTPPWFTPSFCGGQAFFADPQSAFYSLPQFLTFMVDPLQAVYWAFLIFAGLGFWGMYLYTRSCLHLGRGAALVAATVFMFNGFYAHRMIIGHYGYQSFMLAPLIAWLLLRPVSHPDQFWKNLAPALPAAALIAYWFHSGLTTLMIPSALAVVALGCLATIRNKEPGGAPHFLLRGLLAGLLAVGLCASKLNANLTLVGNFARDYYPLPGISDIYGLLAFIFQSLFYSSEHAYQTVTPLWENMVWSAMPHELAYGMTPLPLMVILAGAASFILARRNRAVTNTPHAFWTWAAMAALIAILLLPIALLYYSPTWNAFLKTLPLVGATTSPFRWLIIYLPPLAALTGLAANFSSKYQAVIAIALIGGIPALNALEIRDYYQQQTYDPAPVVNYYRSVAEGKIEPRIIRVGDPRFSDGRPMIDNNLFLKGVSPMRCYNPLYGYRQEKLVTAPLIGGPVDMESAENSLNIHNPACLVFPAENSCRPWDAFSSAQKAELEQFTGYRPYAFSRSTRQELADIATLLSLAMLCLLSLMWLIARIRQTPDQSTD